MKVVFDTNVLIATLLQDHVFHPRAYSVFSKHISTPGDAPLVSVHTLAELYCNLSRMPTQPKISASTAARMIDEAVLKYCGVIELNGDDVVGMIHRLVSIDIKGAATYDALICACAEKAGADILYTFNSRDFLRVWPAGASKIVEP